MKKPGLVSFLAIGLFAVAILACNRPTPATQNISTDTENSNITPSHSSEELVRHTIYRRAIEAVIWSTPAVNFDRMYQAMVHDAKAGEGSNKIVYWSRLFNWKNQTLTPNPDSIYFMPFFNTKNVGPVVLEVPPAEGGSITGSIDDCWQTAIADVGPAGTDQGKGGKYLLLPPGYKDKVPSGYIPLETLNYQGYALLRSILKSNSASDIATAVAYGKRIKLYPLAQAAHPPQTSFTDAIDVVYDATIPWDMRYFESLNRIVQTEPWLPRDKAMINQLRSISIEKASPSAPTRRPRTYSNKPLPKPTPGSPTSTRTLTSRRPSIPMDTGLSPPRLRLLGECLPFSPTPTPIPSTAAAPCTHSASSAPNASVPVRLTS
jgi:hypothetical protein